VLAWGMAMPSTSELRMLDVQTRLEIIGELWDSVVQDLDPDNPSQLAVPETTRALFDERMREYRANPEIGVPWPALHEQLRKLT
jgi:putative addiction module component (TIGR02574 family)